MLMLRKICSFCSSFFDSSFCAPFQNYVIPTMIPTMIPTLTRARLIPSILISQSSNIVQMDGWMDGWMCQEYVLYYRIAMRESVLWISDVINLVLVLAV